MAKQAIQRVCSLYCLSYFYIGTFTKQEHLLSLLLYWIFSSKTSFISFLYLTVTLIVLAAALYLEVFLLVILMETFPFFLSAFIVSLFFLNLTLTIFAYFFESFAIEVQGLGLSDDTFDDRSSREHSFLGGYD